jgi:hypothetical protein
LWASSSLFDFHIALPPLWDRKTKRSHNNQTSSIFVAATVTEEEELLRIRFWEGSYHAGFGSIFPTEDICSLIPEKEADVAILEEPEHLNWFRVPATPEQVAAAAAAAAVSAAAADSGQPKEEKVDDKEGSGDKVEEQDLGDKSNHSAESKADLNALGWAHKVSHKNTWF